MKGKLFCGILAAISVCIAVSILIPRKHENEKKRLDLMNEFNVEEDDEEYDEEDE